MEKLEIEDKFLLKRVPELTVKQGWKIQHIRQYYLQGGVRLREILENTRKYGTVKSYVATIKNKLKSGVYKENEKGISAKTFKEMILYSKGEITTVSKLRFSKKVGKVKWDIDRYADFNLVTAEVELPKEGYKYKIPKEVQKEVIINVTELQDFTNRSLSEPVSKKDLIKRYSE